MHSLVLAEPIPIEDAVTSLRAALGEPSLDLVYRRSANGTWIDGFGMQIADSAFDDGRDVIVLERAGDWIAAIIRDRTTTDVDTGRIADACDAVAGVIDEERLKAELRAQLRDEQASRARIVTASDRRRRRFERNLHDGAQQRLVGLALMLRLVGRRAQDDRSVTDALDSAVAELDDAISDLRELAGGLHPAIVTDAGLAAAVETLAEHPGIPVELSVDLPGRLPDLVEVAGFYLVAEALANANKHSGGAVVRVSARVDGDALLISVADDGQGGADPSGSGLVGLADRLGALGGRLDVDSVPGRGTTISAVIPLQTPYTGEQQSDDILLRVLPDTEGSARRAGRRAFHPQSIGSDADRRRRALKWIVWQNVAGPLEIVDAQPEEADLLFAKSLLLFVGGNRNISPQRRAWVLGYLTAAGYTEQVLSLAADYDDDDTIVELMAHPRMDMAKRVLLYDALRACAMDTSEIAADAFDPVLRAADTIGLPRDVVADLHEIVLEEVRLRRRRHDIVVVPAMPKVLNDVVAMTDTGEAEPP